MTTIASLRDRSINQSSEIVALRTFSEIVELIGFNGNCNLVKLDVDGLEIDLMSRFFSFLQDDQCVATLEIMPDFVMNCCTWLRCILLSCFKLII